LPLELLMECEVAVRNSQATRDAIPVGGGYARRSPTKIQTNLQSAGGDVPALAGLHACARN
jgi:hypothetical protein